MKKTLTFDTLYTKTKYIKLILNIIKYKLKLMQRASKSPFKYQYLINIKFISNYALKNTLVAIMLLLFLSNTEKTIAQQSNIGFEWNNFTGHNELVKAMDFSPIL